MGSGSYSYLKSKSRSLSYATMDTSAIFAKNIPIHLDQIFYSDNNLSDIKKW